MDLKSHPRLERDRRNIHLPVSSTARYARGGSQRPGMASVRNVPIARATNTTVKWPSRISLGRHRSDIQLVAARARRAGTSGGGMEKRSGETVPRGIRKGRRSPVVSRQATTPRRNLVPDHIKSQI